jgi:hypothetical protein
MEKVTFQRGISVKVAVCGILFLDIPVECLVTDTTEKQIATSQIKQVPYYLPVCISYMQAHAEI